MSNTALRGHKLQNFLQTILLLAGMALILCALGWMFFGMTGIVWAFFLGLGVLLFSPRITPRAMLKAYGARQLEPQEAPALYQALGELSRRAGLPQTPTLYYVRSSVMNSFAVGSSEQAAIAVTDGLLRGAFPARNWWQCWRTRSSHVRNNDMWVMGLADVISRITSLFSLLGQILLLLYLPMLMAGYQLAWAPVLLLIAAPSISALLQLALSRSREYDADLSGAVLSGDPRALASALNKMERYQGNILERIFMPGPPRSASLAAADPSAHGRACPAFAGNRPRPGKGESCYSIGTRAGGKSFSELSPHNPATTLANGVLVLIFPAILVR